MTISRRIAIALLLVLFAAGLGLRHFGEGAGPGGPLTAVVVEDSAHRTPAIAAILTAPEVLAAVNEKHVAWHVIDQAVTGPDLVEVQFAIEGTKNKPLPALVLRTGAGKPKISPLPTSAASMAATLRAAAGG